MKLLTYLKLQNLIFSIFFLGVLFNGIAVLENDCKMPVLTSYKFSSNTHESFYDKTDVNYFYLTDILKIKDFHFSIGDIFLTIGGLGLGWMLICQIKQFPRLKKGEKWKE